MNVPHERLSIFEMVLAIGCFVPALIYVFLLIAAIVLFRLPVDAAGN